MGVSGAMRTAPKTELPLLAICIAAAAATAAAAAAPGPRVHVLATICGKDYVKKTMPMIKSLLWHRTAPLTLHIIADRPGVCPSPPPCWPTHAGRLHASYRAYLTQRARTARQALDRTFPKDRPGSAALEVDYIHAERHVAMVEESFPANFFTNMGACSETSLVQLPSLHRGTQILRGPPPSHASLTCCSIRRHAADIRCRYSAGS